MGIVNFFSYVVFVRDKNNIINNFAENFDKTFLLTSYFLVIIIYS